MKVPINWLREYVKTDLSPEEIGDKLTYIGHMQDGPIQEIAEDHVLDLEIRQNRPDALSIVGIARELAAVTKKDLSFPEGIDDLGPVQNNTKIVIEGTDLCYRFHGITIEGIEIKQSPEWMKKRLEAYGVKSINNIVDITNYVSSELGMPLHAYNADKIADRTITIRRARKGEKLTLFGGKKVAFDSDDLIHSDSEGPIGFGGLMGGQEKSVQNNSSAIILEAAVYNQASIRRSSIRHDIRTDASTRLEKFLNPELVEVALKRAVKLILKLAGGKIVDNTDVYPKPQERKKIVFDLHEIKRLGGIDVDADTVADIFTRLELEVTDKKSDTFTVSIPYFRTDLEGEADLVEEVLRLYGYDKIPEKMISTPTPKDIQSPLFDFEEKIKDIMTAVGFDEQITEPLTMETKPQRVPIRLQNSLTAEKQMLRTTLKHTLLDVTRARKKYRMNCVRVFEVGKVYFLKDKQHVEQSTLGIILQDKNASYFEAKGIVELLADRLERELKQSFYTIEQLNNEKVPTFYIELTIEALFDEEKTKASHVLTTPPQIILHDFSFVVSKEIKVGEVLEAIKQLNPLVYTVELGELPREGKDGKKSVFIHVSYHNPTKALSEEDVAPVRKEIINTLEKQFNAIFK